MSKPKIVLVAACDRNQAIGKGNTLPWKHRADMKAFRKLTLGGTVVMGSKTYLSMGAKPLPERTNIVLTRFVDKFAHHQGAHFVDKIEDSFRFATGEEPTLLVIGGADVYRQFLPIADVIHLSRLDLVVDGADTFFPEINMDEWEGFSSEEAATDGDANWRRCVYVRK